MHTTKAVNEKEVSMKRLFVLAVVILLFCGISSGAMLDHRYDLKQLIHGDLEPTAFSTSDFRDSSRYFAMPYANPNTTLGVVNVNSTLKKYGNASIFIKSMNSNVTVADSSEYTFGTNNHSISTWIYFPQAVSTVYLWQHIQDVNNYDRLGILEGATNSVTYTRVRGGVGIGTATVTYGSAFAPGIWYHVAVIQNGTDTQLYINGTAAGASFARTGSMTDLNGPVIVGVGRETGGIPTGPFSYYHMDEVTVLNGGIAPTIDELQGEFPLYLNGSAGG